jgi:protocatechuate 3,4-dioxygenase beta subunit
MKRNFIVAILFLATIGLMAQTNPRTTTQYTGTVVDEQGRPVPGAEVDSYEYQSPPVTMDREFRQPELKQHTLTDARGGFAVASSPMTILVLVKKAGLAPAWRTWPSDDDGSEPLVLTTPATVSGVVTNESGQPVADADVWVSEATVPVENDRYSQLNDIFGRLGRECFSARTTADGHFRVENLPANAHIVLSAAKPGMAQHGTAGHYLGSQDFQSGDENIKLLLAPAGTIEGKVVVQETGQPVPNVEVWLLPSDGNSTAHGPVKSGADGTFRIPDLQQAKYNVWAVLPDELTANSTIAPDYDLATVAAGETNRDVVIRTTPGVLVEVSVVSTNDLKPLPDVAVSSGRLTANTGGDGVARLRLMPGTNWFSATKPDWSPRQTTAKIKSGQATQVRIEMIPPPHISGIVRDSTGAPAPGVRVSFHPGQYPMAPFYEETSTDENGRYEMTIRQESNWFFSWSGPVNNIDFVMARDLKRNLAAIQEIGDTNAVGFHQKTEPLPTNIDLALQPGVTISGSVKEAGGTPMANIAINLTILSSHSFAGVENKPVKTDAQGSFSYPALPQGREYNIFNLTAKGYGSAYGNAKPQDTKTSHFEFPAIVLKKADRILAGQVLGADGRPVSGVSVRFNGQGQRMNFTDNIKSDDNGRFVFKDVCEGPVTVSAESEHTSANASAQGGDTNVMLRLGITMVQSRPFLTPPIQLAGTVRDVRGQAVAGVKMTMFSYQTGLISSETDSRGHYEFTWQKRLSNEENEWLLARDFSAGSAAIRQIDETTTNLDLTLQDGITLSMKVSDTDGLLLTNATAKMMLWQGNRGTTIDSQPFMADERGRIRMTALPQGERYEVSISAPGHASNTRRIEADETKTKLLELPPVVLMPTDCDVAGQVLDKDGKPAAGVNVHLFQGGGQTIMTDADGHFIFHGVPRGLVSFDAGLQQPGTSAYKNSGMGRGMGGDTNVVIRLGTNPDSGATMSQARITTSGTVLDPSGKPAPGVFLSVLSAVGFNNPARTDPGGKYMMQRQITILRTNKVIMLARDLEHNWAAAVEMDAMTTNLDVHLQPGLTLSGSVQDSRGKPVTNAIVQLVPFPPGELRSVMNRQSPTNVTSRGMFSFNALPKGAPYRVRITADGYWTTNFRVAAADTKVEKLDLTRAVLELADQQVAGQVLDLSGKPSWGAEVSVEDDESPPKHVSHTDAEGHFAISGVPKGLLTVRATFSSSGDNPRYLLCTNQVQGGDKNVVLKLRTR